jgi:hypothetical protein
MKRDRDSRESREIGEKPQTSVCGGLRYKGNNHCEILRCAQDDNVKQKQRPQPSCLFQLALQEQRGREGWGTRKTKTTADPSEVPTKTVGTPRNDNASDVAF